MAYLPVRGFKREQVMRSTGYRCWYCGIDLRTQPQKSIDHVIPASKGGTSAIVNLVPACKPCNSAKKNRSLDAFRIHVARANGYHFTKKQLAILDAHGLDMRPIIAEKIAAIRFWGERTEWGTQDDDGRGDFWPVPD